MMSMSKRNERARANDAETRIINNKHHHHWLYTGVSEHACVFDEDNSVSVFIQRVNRKCVSERGRALSLSLNSQTITSQAHIS